MSNTYPDKFDSASNKNVVPDEAIGIVEDFPPVPMPDSLQHYTEAELKEIEKTETKGRFHHHANCRHPLYPQLFVSTPISKPVHANVNQISIVKIWPPLSCKASWKIST